MPVNPKGSCGACKKVIETVKASINHVRKALIIYSMVFFLVVELLSRHLVGLESYDLFWYPILTNAMFAITFLNYWLLRERLKFCFRKSFVFFALFLYYLFNALAVIFQMCGSIYYTIVSYSLFLIIAIGIYMSIENYKNQ